MIESGPTKRNGSGSRPLRDADKLLNKAKELIDDDDFEESPLRKLVDRLGGKGSVKVWRVSAAGEEKYACSIPVDQVMVDDFEDGLARRCGGGEFICKFVAGDRTRGSVTIHIDPEMFPPKKTANEVRKEGGPMPSTVAELVDVLKTVLPSMQTQQVVAAGQPTFADLLRIQERNQDRLLELIKDQRQTQQQLAPAPAPKAFGEQLQEVASTVKSMRAITGGMDGGGGRRDPDPKDEKRSLAARIFEGPLEKGATRMADRLVDKFMAEDEAEKKGEQTQQRTPAPPPQQAGPGKPVTSIPKGAIQKKYTPEQLAAFARKGPSAPRAKDAVPEAVKKEPDPAA